MKNTTFDKERIERYFSGDYNAEDAEYFASLFDNREDGRNLQTYLQRHFSGYVREEDPERKNLDHILFKIHYNINQGKQVSGNSRTVSGLKLFLRIAAAIILPVALFWGVKGYLSIKSRQEARMELTAPAWTRARFVLPDGTTGWLNSNSSISYNLDFVNDRHVDLKGEAFFDVFKDSRRPFIVHTGEVNLKVSGTRFNVSSYETEKDIEVVLEEGSLIFNPVGDDTAYLMKPNDLVTYNRSSKEFRTDIVQPQKYLSWKEGKLVFRNDPLDVICRRLGRWYNVEVEMKVSAPIENMRLRATFVDENLEEVLGLLKRSLPIDYKVLGGTLNPDHTYSKKKILILQVNR
jgi:ferric-dicitrate binding protein FerR (iron transport regulator)